MEGAQEPMSTEKAIGEVNVIMNEVAVLGGNDSEIPQLRDIIAKLQSGQLTPPEALKWAHEIRDRKSSYH